MKNQEHWNKRGNNFFVYKGEKFYTITPIPYYVKRRKVLLSLALKWILKDEIRRICDFGCGDGWYIQYFAKFAKGKEWIGIDLSTTMIEKAKENFPDTSFYVNDHISDEIKNIDLVIVFAVFAHILEDDNLRKVINSIRRSLSPKGKLIVFEQVAPISYGGKTFKRRSIKEYLTIISQTGFELKEKYLVSFNGHRFFERYIAKFWYKRISKGNSEFERRIIANNNWMFKTLSMLFLKTTINPVTKDPIEGWGNAFMVFEKK